MDEKVYLSLIIIGVGLLISGFVFSNPQIVGLGTKPDKKGILIRSFKDGEPVQTLVYTGIADKMHRYNLEQYGVESDYSVYRNFYSFDIPNFDKIDYAKLKISAWTSGYFDSSERSKIPEQADPPVNIILLTSNQGSSLEKSDWNSIGTSIKSSTFEDGIKYEDPKTVSADISDYLKPGKPFQIAIIFADEGYVEGLETLALGSVEVDIEGRYKVTVSGSVKNFEGELLDNVQISSDTTITFSHNGEFSIDVLEESSTEITFSKKGYYDNTRTVNLSEPKTLNVKLEKKSEAGGFKMSYLPMVLGGLFIMIGIVGFGKNKIEG